MKDLQIKYVLEVLAVFFIFGFFTYWVLYRGIPLHSDVTWLFRLQISKDNLLTQSVPASLKAITAYPTSLAQACREWHALTGRYNCADIAALRLTAYLAKDNADLWRLTYIIFLSLSVGIWYLISRILKISKIVAGYFSTWLVLIPIDVWTNYKTAEPRAVFFLMLAILLTLLATNKRFWLLYIAGLCMIFSVLTKENFALAWILVPVFYLFCVNDKKIKHLLISQAISITFLAVWYLYLRSVAPLKTAGYVQINQGPQESLVHSLGTYIINLLPPFLSSHISWGLIVALFSIFWAYKQRNLRKLFTELLSLRWLIAGLVLVLVLHFLPYYLTGRQILSQYILPANYFFVLILAIIGSIYYEKIVSPNLNRPWKKTVFVIVLFGTMTTQIPIIVKNSQQDRIDQNAWQNLIIRITKEVPTGNHIVLQFNEPYMSETARGLEANTLLNGRYDLVYHLEITDHQLYDSAPEFVKYNVDSFNLSKAPLPRGMNNIVYIKADRNGTRGNPYLNYTISFNKPPK